MKQIEYIGWIAKIKNEDYIGVIAFPSKKCKSKREERLYIDQQVRESFKVLEKQCVGSLQTIMTGKTSIDDYLSDAKKRMKKYVRTL